MARPLLACACLMLSVMLGSCGETSSNGTSAWLGLNENTVRYLGPVDAFSKHDVVYDRSLEMQAGSVPGEPQAGMPSAELSLRLREDDRLGMTPVSTIEYRGYDRAGYSFRSDPEFPQERSAGEAAGRNTIGSYVEGFVRSASATLKLVHERYPGMRVLFEPMNEPWGYTTPQYNGAQYADVIAQLLPAAVAAGIPANDIYVGATGEGCTSVASCTANSWIGEMYAAQPALRKEIQGWYFHPYGPPSGLLEFDNGGIQSLPVVRRGIFSGRDNVIVSEVGFCAKDVNNPGGSDEGVDCHGIQASSGASAAEMLTGLLKQAAIYHREGWLKALIVYSRNDGGWAMQLPGGAFTPSGRALEAFAESAEAR